MLDTAGSSGVRKKLGELLRWLHEPEGLAGSVVEAAGEAGEVIGGVDAQVRAFGHVLAQQAVDASMSSSEFVLCDVVLPGGSVLDHRAVDDVDQVAFEYASSASDALCGCVAGQ